VFNRHFIVEIYCFSISSSQEKGLYVSGASKFLNTGYCNVQGCVSETISSFKVRFHAQDVIQSHLRPRKASPVKWSALLGISYVDVYALFEQIVDTDWLVLLCSNVHHCRSILVLDAQVSSCLLNKQTQNGVVAMPCRKMEGVKLIISLDIHPLLEHVDFTLPE